MKRFVYGFACANSIKEAYLKAEIELYRNDFVLSRIKTTENSNTSVQETRVMYFSTPQGYDLFTEKIEKTKLVRLSTLKPEPIVDTAIKGPRDKYSKIWRCPYPQSSYGYLSDKVDIFKF